MSVDVATGGLISSQSSENSPSVGLLLQTTDQEVTDQVSGHWYFEPSTCEPDDNFFLSLGDDCGILDMFNMFDDFV